ncbi:MAG: YjbF family lipoprotein [Rhodobacteraceae bacterium]|nr:YjbF family lipoprotein [Paracoccaceae bacterium]
MGAVLALMTRFKPKRTCFALAGLSLLLAACSSDHSTQPGIGGIAIGMAKARLQKGAVETADGDQKAPQVTRAQMAAFGRPVVYMTVPRFGVTQPAVELAVNGRYRTYMGSDQSTVTLQSGIVTATRGLQVDLIAQELSVSPSALFRGSFPKTYSRTQRSLTGEGVLADYTYNCALAPKETDETLTIFGQAHRTREYTELCGNKKRAFQNSYWVDRAGTVWQSHQSISKEVGHLVLQRVVR